MPKPEFELPDFATLEDEALDMLDIDDPVSPRDLAWVDAYLDAVHDAGEEEDDTLPQWLPWDLPDFSERYGT